MSSASPIPPEISDLVEAARTVAARAYAPYSGLHVGAALRTASGQIHLGCNVENAAYGPSSCAERSAIFAAVSAEGPRPVIKELATIMLEQPAAPCGACRQVIAEFADPQTRVAFDTADGIEILTIAELLPHTFHIATHPR